MFPLGRSARGLYRPRAECFSLTAGSRYGPRRSLPKTFARTCIPGNRTLLPALCRSVSSPNRDFLSLHADLIAAINEEIASATAWAGANRDEAAALFSE